jgi:glutathione S-transferase
MENNLVLYNGPTSPFGRKCKIASLVLGIRHKEETINVYKSTFLDEHNPLRQIPTLIADGKVISDSDNICLYLDSLSTSKSLYPKDRYWDCMTMISVTNGIMENGVNRYIEISAIPENEQRKKSIERYEKKILRSIAWIEKRFEEFNTVEITMDQISIACALDYTSLRFTSDWELDNPKLKDWFNDISSKEFIKNTKPGVSFKYE